MKIGDKVRFLSETGGGRISGFKGNNIVLVEDEDGFEIPTPINEVVVVTDDDYSSAHLVETMKSTEIRELTDDELAKKLEEGRAELFNLRFQMATSQLDNTARVRLVKRDIARVQTEMRARQIAADKAAAQN